MFHSFEDEMEIDDWFQTTKEAAESEFYKHVYARKDEKKAKIKFNKKMDYLLKRYNQEYALLEKRKNRRAKFKKPFIALIAWWEKFKMTRKTNFQKHKKGFKTWRFNREYEHLMKK